MKRFYRDAPDDSGLSHQVHEGVLYPDQDVCGHPVAAALLDVGARGVRVVASRRRRSRSHGTIAHRTGARTGLERQQESLDYKKDAFFKFNIKNKILLLHLKNIFLHQKSSVYNTRCVTEPRPT